MTEVPKHYQPSDDHPFGRVLQDTPCQPIYNHVMVKIVAELTERITGDTVTMVRRSNAWYLFRHSGGKTVRA
jgi:hypothetical protein